MALTIPLMFDLLIAKKIAARTNENIGPAIAIKNSEDGFICSFLIPATPPKKKSVIELTSIFLHFATKECESSCKSTDTNNKIAETNPINQYIDVEYPIK